MFPLPTDPVFGQLSSLQTLCHPRLALLGTPICGWQQSTANHAGNTGPIRSNTQLIGLREKLQENPIFHGKIDGFL